MKRDVKQNEREREEERTGVINQYTSIQVNVSRVRFLQSISSIVTVTQASKVSKGTSSPNRSHHPAQLGLHSKQMVIAAIAAIAAISAIAAIEAIHTLWFLTLANVHGQRRSDLSLGLGLGPPAI